MNRQTYRINGLGGGDGILAQQQQMRSALGDVGNRIIAAAAAVTQQNVKLTATAASTVIINKKETRFENENLIDKLSLNPTIKFLKPQQPVQPAVVDVSKTTTARLDVTSRMDISEVNDDQQQSEKEEDNNDDEEAAPGVDEDDDDEMVASMHSAGNECSLLESIVDIDACDVDNPQLVAEYVKDIYKYLTDLEKRFRVSNTFLQGKIVTNKMRSVLIDWLIQVHQKFHLLQETLYLCVQIIDAYLEAEDVPKMQLQLVGVTAMFLASKYEEMYVPAIEDFVYMTDNTYTKSEIRLMEISILKTMGFLLCKPLPLHFLRRFSKAGQADPKQHTLAKYFMELTLHDGDFSSMDPSYLAACSLCISFKLLNGPTEWNNVLEFYSSYKENSLLPGMQKICKIVLKSMDTDYKYKAATTKYASTKFMRISSTPELKGSLIKELASMIFN